MLPSTARLLRLRDLGGQGWLSSRLLRGFHSISFALAAHREHAVRPGNRAQRTAMKGPNPFQTSKAFQAERLPLQFVKLLALAVRKPPDACKHYGNNANEM